MKRFRVLLKLAHACALRPELRVGQIVSNAIGRHSAVSAQDIYFVDDDLLLYVLDTYNKEAL